MFLQRLLAESLFLHTILLKKIELKLLKWNQAELDISKNRL
jgi:hypothetical protein